MNSKCNLMNGPMAWAQNKTYIQCFLFAGKKRKRKSQDRSGDFGFNALTTGTPFFRRQLLLEVGIGRNFGTPKTHKKNDFFAKKCYLRLCARRLPKFTKKKQRFFRQKVLPPSSLRSSVKNVAVSFDGGNPTALLLQDSQQICQET